MLEATLNARVTQRTEVSPGLLILRVSPAGWALPEFTPGQFSVLALPGLAKRCEGAEAEAQAPDPQKLIRRAYSIASSSIEKEFLEFYISLVRSGALTPRLFALELGDRLWLSPKPTGMFTLKDVPEDKHVVFIATGTGLAPYMSMLRTYLEADKPRKFAVLHGAYHSWDLGYRTELFTLQRLCRNFAYLPIINGPQGELAPWKGPTGFVQDLWTGGAIRTAWGFHPTPENTHIFLCGNPAMIESVTSLLAGEGFIEHSPQKPGQVHAEKYW
ncbi:MAG: ferredoxin--NADP reductase [Verrucomicrobia bacterium]|nr:ferredoxin--NADP reductase [Verrucomicrobiota bacterium]